MLDTYQALSVRREARIIRIEINNPPMNGMSPAIHGELSTIFSRLNEDPEARVVVLTGAGDRAFCAGADPKVMAAGAGDHARWLETVREARDIVLGMLACDLPIIGRINGHAIGVGATIALCCDITVIVDTAKIGDTHVNIGLSAGDGGSLLWPHLVGMMKAKRYLLTGDLLTGREAADIGLVTESTTREEFDPCVARWITRFVEGPPLALRLTKRSLNMMLRQQAQTYMDAHLGLETLTRLSADFQEARAAMVEKRSPVFTGK